MTAHIESIRSIGQFFEADVVVKRWLRKPLRRKYLGNGKGVWGCPDETYGTAGFELARRLDAAAAQLLAGDLGAVLASEREGAER